jgi:hypothetical protein
MLALAIDLAGSPMPEPDRRVSVRVDGPISAGGRVSVGLLSEKLTAAQRSLVQHRVGPPRRRTSRNLGTEVLHGCQPLFVEARRGSLEIVTETPPSVTLLRSRGEL